MKEKITITILQNTGAWETSNALHSIANQIEASSRLFDQTVRNPLGQTIGCVKIGETEHEKRIKDLRAYIEGQESQ